MVKKKAWWPQTTWEWQVRKFLLQMRGTDVQSTEEKPSLQKEGKWETRSKKRSVTWRREGRDSGLWSFTGEKPLCKLCGERGTLVHILLTCMAVLSQASMARSPEHRLSSWNGNDKHKTNLIDPENKEEPPVAAGDEVSSEGNHTFPQPIMF